MESTIIVHWGLYDKSDDEIFVDTRFMFLFRDEWINSDFAKFCIKSIDGCEHIGDQLIKSPILGLIPPAMLSGGVKTLLIAYNRKDLYFPLGNLGDNCAEAIFRSGIGSPTRWMWLGYTPKLLPEQKVLVESTGEIVLGKDWKEWEAHHAPDPATLIPGIKHACDYEDGE